MKDYVKEIEKQHFVEKKKTTEDMSTYMFK